MTNTSITPPATIGFIGLGNMGKPMAKLLAVAGYKLYVLSDLNADAVKTFCAGTGEPAAAVCSNLAQSVGVHHYAARRQSGAQSVDGAAWCC